MLSAISPLLKRNPDALHDYEREATNQHDKQGSVGCQRTVNRYRLIDYGLGTSMLVLFMPLARRHFG